MVWLPNSATDLIAATENNLVICDTRKPWVVKQKIVDTGNTRIVSSIKFDPFDSNRYATLHDTVVKIYDLRKKDTPIFEVHAADRWSLGGMEWAQYR